MTPTPRTVVPVVLLAILLGAAPAWAQTAKVRYEGAFERETAVRTLLDRSGEPTAAERSDVLRQVARVVTSGYLYRIAPLSITFPLLAIA